MPAGFMGQAEVAIVKYGRLSVGAAGAVRWSRGVCHGVMMETQADYSQVRLLSSASLRMGLTLTRRVTAIVQAGEASGEWRNLLVSDVARPAVAVPMYEAGLVVRLVRHAALELVAVNVRNVYRGDDATGASVLFTYPLLR